jgi:hypothetical protein
MSAKKIKSLAKLTLCRLSIEWSFWRCIMCDHLAPILKDCSACSNTGVVAIPLADHNIEVISIEPAR